MKMVGFHVAVLGSLRLEPQEVPYVPGDQQHHVETAMDLLNPRHKRAINPFCPRIS